MKKETEKKMNVAIEAAGVASSFLSTINPAFLAISIITFSINRVVGHLSEDNIVKRINKFEEKLQNNKISIEEFREKVANLTEHNEYVVRNNLNNILLTCIPEAVDVYISVLIELIMNQENTIHEEICEILSQLNKNDLILLSMINKYKKIGTRKYFFESIENKFKENEEIDQKNQEIDKYNKNTTGIKKIKITKFNDRDQRYNTDTIFWKDFAEMFHVKVPEMGQMLLRQGIDENGKLTMDWAFFVRSFIKLEKLGLIQMDYINTVGTINSLNIDRFHLTLFGQKLLYYIDKNGFEE